MPAATVAPTAPCSADGETAERIRQRVYSLAALGYPVETTLRLASAPPETLSALPGIDLATVDRLEAVYADHRDIEAENHPLLTLTAEEIKGARAAAELHGFRTPDWYDDDGTLRTARRRKAMMILAKRREHALEGIEVFRLVVNGATDARIADRLGIQDRSVHRWRSAKAGLHGGVSESGIWFPDESCADRFREIELALDRYFASPGADPYLTLVELGIMNAPVKYDARAVGWTG